MQEGVFCKSKLCYRRDTYGMGNPLYPNGHLAECRFGITLHPCLTSYRFWCDPNLLYRRVKPDLKGSLPLEGPSPGYVPYPCIIAGKHDVSLGR